MRKTMMIMLAGFACSGIWAEPVTAQQIGNVSLPLGMSRVDALAALQKSYEVKEASGGDNLFFIHEKTGHTPFNVIGSVSFEGGRLVWVSRDWSTAEHGQDKIALQIARALRQMDGEHNCAISSNAFDRPDGRIESVDVDCDGHGVTVISQEGGIPSVQENWKR